MFQKILTSVLLLSVCPVFAQQIEITELVELQSSFSQGNTPLWLNANKYGLSSLSGNNGYLRSAFGYSRTFNTEQQFRFEVGSDLVLPYGYKYEGIPGQEHYTSHFIVQQAYTGIYHKQLGLTIGAKQQPMELRNQTLSSGAQALGINARPIPQIRLGVEDFWNIPGTGKRLAIKGHAAFGIMTDGEWESLFAHNSENKHSRLTRYHQKAGYLRYSPHKIPLTVTGGIEMAAQFGGYVYNWKGTSAVQNSVYKYTLKNDLSSYWHAFSSSGRGDTGETQFKNTEGNQLGSWVLRLDWKGKNWSIGAYADHFFEDHSSMFLLDYDGYGTGENWNKKKETKFVFYPPRDMQYGIEAHLPYHWLDNFVIEFVNSAYQSGPVYHDHNPSNPDHLGGRDDYYNHGTLPGWQHWGQVMGNPLFLSPIYNDNGYIGTACNRFRAWHLGAHGAFSNPAGLFSYRTMFSYQKGWGTYENPYYHPRENTSIMIEGSWMPLYFPGTTLVLSCGGDFGKLRGNNTGVQLTLRYKIGMKTL